MNHARKRAQQRRQRREGAALLIVLFILMMATGTAMFSLQSTQFEQRAAGSLSQAMRTKFIAEGATVGVLALCYELGPSCAELKRAQENLTENRRLKYALPQYGGRETVYELSQTDLTTGDTSGSWKAEALPTDRTLAGGGTARAYTPSFTTVMEKWNVPNPGETRPRFRLIVSTYGQLQSDAEAGLALAAGEVRQGHESVSATRAFFDVK